MLIYFLLVILVLFLIIISWFFVGFSKKTEGIVWGVNFSQKHAQSLGLDWRETYLAILDDLRVRNLKIASYWDYIEWQEGNYNFGELDWQIEEAEKRGAGIILVIGMKTPGWPECHIPNWARSLSKEEQQEKILKLIKEIVSRYQESKAIRYWQVENEPFFPFGECPWKDRKFLRKEIELVESLDSKKRQVIISESGEFPLWISAARYGDMVGITIYKKAWFKEINSYISYPFPPIFYWRKARFIKAIFDKEVICIELQAEPWGPKLLYDSSLEEQEKSMDLERFQKNIKFAKKTGLKEFYLWGAEWWYWLKEKQNKPEIWQEAKKLFK